MNFSKSMYPILTNNWVKLCSIVKEFNLKSKNFFKTYFNVCEVFSDNDKDNLIKGKAVNGSESFTDIRNITLIK